MSDLASYAGDVARLLWGDENSHLSSSRELRFGTNGSKSVDLDKGVWSDHSETPGSPEAGGGVIDMVRIAQGVSAKDAVAWLRSKGFDVPDRAPSPRDRAAPRSTPKPRAAPKEKAEAKASGPKPRKTIVRTYDYRDLEGALVYQVVRYEPKTFSQRRPSPTEADVWFWGLDAGDYMRRGPGQDWFRYDEKRWTEWKCTERTTLETAVEHGLYLRPELEEALAEGALIFLPEGEKDVDTLRELGAPATTNSGGAKHWSEAHSRVFAGAEVVIPLDHDKPGRERGEILARALQAVGASVKLLDISHHWSDVGEKGDITDWIRSGGLTLERLYELVDRLPTWTPALSEEMADLAGDRFDQDPGEGYVPRFNLVMWDDLEREQEPHEWLIKGLVTRGEMILAPGASGSGKTFLWLDAAMAVARGVDFMGYRVRRGGVVYQAGEGYKGLRSKRLVAYRQKNNLFGGPALPFAILGSPIDLYSDDADTRAMIADIKFAASHWSERLELVIIDTLSTATPGANENASEDISRVLKRCEMIRAATGAAVLLVHHMNADGTKARGHTSLGANVDSVIVSRIRENAHDKRGRKIREVEVRKQKDGEDGLKIPFVLSSIKIGQDEDGDAVTSCVIEAPDGENVTADPKAGNGRLSPQAYNFLRAVEKAAEEHGLDGTIAGVPGLSYGTTVVEYGHVRDAFAAASFEDDDRDPEKRAATIRQGIKRQGETLLAKGLIGRHDKFLWRTGKPLSTPSSSDTAPPSSGPSWVPPDHLADDPGWTGLD